MGRPRKIKAADILPIVVEANKSKTVSVDELAEQLMEACGGVRQFATQYVQEMNKTKGVARSRMLESVMRAVGTSSSLSKKRGDDETQLSDQDLMDEALSLLRKAGRADAA